MTCTQYRAALLSCAGPRPVPARRRASWAGVLVVCALAAAYTPSRVEAATPKPSRKTAALSALTLAKFHYDQKQYEKAAGLFMEAWRIDRDPVYLFNAARALQRGMKLDAAEKHFEQLRAIDNLPEKLQERVRLHLDEIRNVRKAIHAAREEKTGVTAGAASAPDAAASAPDAAARASGGWKNPAGWASAGLGLIATGVGGWMLASWSADQDDLDTQTGQRGDDKLVTGIPYEPYKQEQEALNSRLRLGAATAGVGVLALGAGAWMLLSTPEEASVAFLPIASGGHLLLTARF